MVKSISCKDAGKDCNWSASAESVERIDVSSYRTCFSRTQRNWIKFWKHYKYQITNQRKL